MIKFKGVMKKGKCIFIVREGNSIIFDDIGYNENNICLLQM